MEDLEQSLSNINKIKLNEEKVENEENEKEEEFSFYRELQVAISPSVDKKLDRFNYLFLLKGFSFLKQCG